MAQLRGKAMTWMSRDMEKHVKKHKIITNDGKKERIIFAPDHILKMMQTKLRENVLLNLRLPSYVHGFVPGKSLVTNASAHVDSGLVVNLDLKDFFPNIGVKRVFGFWHWAFNGSDRAAWAATRITTFEDHLCQGFVTSPDIANHVAYKLDIRLAALAAKKDLRYTRYADDLTFSSHAYDGNCQWLIDAVTEIAAAEGFTVNPKKIAIMRPRRRQVVTGLIVNRMAGDEQFPRIPRRERRRLRAMCDKGNAMLDPSDKGEVDGWIAYINSVQPQVAQRLRDQLQSRIADPKWTRQEVQEHFARKGWRS